MIRSVIISFLLIASPFLRSQIVISNLSLTDTTQNIFYIGVDNIIKISGKQYNPSIHTVTIMDGGVTISRLNGTYTIRAVSETDNCQIFIKQGSKIIFKKNFIVRQVGDLVAKYAGVQDSIATVNQLLANPFLYVTIPGCYYKHNVSITSFSATFIYSNADSIHTYAVGNLLTTEQKDVIKKLVRGNKILFDQIYALGPDSRRRELEPFMITIK